MERYVHMGSFTKPHGIAGEIVLDWYGDSPFSPSMDVFVQQGDGEPIPIVIDHVRTKNGRLLLHIQGIADRNAAEGLRGKKVFTKRSSLPPLDSDEAYIVDLLGAEVVLKNGSCVGTFSHILSGTGGTVWSITSPDGTEILFPAEPAFIHAFDREHTRIIIDPPEGLLELYQTQ
ncbi:MAG: 16S rRNA processing protein RimM [Desulfovibrio sp.]|nr:16S rRNA processing protein RimM [Desulfovibrio sp.]